MYTFLTEKDFIIERAFIDLETESKIIQLEHTRRLNDIGVAMVTEGYSERTAAALYSKEMDVYLEAEQNMFQKLIAWFKKFIQNLMGTAPKKDELTTEQKKAMVTLPFSPPTFKEGINGLVKGIDTILTSRKPDGSINVLGTVLKIGAEGAGLVGLKAIYDKIFTPTKASAGDALIATTQAAADTYEAINGMESKASEAESAAAKETDPEKKSLWQKAISFVKSILNWVKTNLTKGINAIKSTFNKIFGKNEEGVKEDKKEDDKGDKEDSKDGEKADEGTKNSPESKKAVASDADGGEKSREAEVSKDNTDTGNEKKDEKKTPTKSTAKTKITIMPRGMTKAQLRNVLANEEGVNEYKSYVNMQKSYVGARQRKDEKKAKEIFANMEASKANMLALIKESVINYTDADLVLMMEAYDIIGPQYIEIEEISDMLESTDMMRWEISDFIDEIVI